MPNKGGKLKDSTDFLCVDIKHLLKGKLQAVQMAKDPQFLSGLVTDVFCIFIPFQVMADYHP